MSKTPLVKTTGRASSARRGSNSARGQSLATKSGSTQRLSSRPATRRLDSRHLSRSVPMIVLCGFPISNYYNKVKLALLEKGIAFSEENVGTGSADPAVLAASPLAKIPFIRTDAGPLCESQAILEYLEDAHPEPALLPADPFAAAKVRELVTFIDLHVELVARELYPKAFFGGTISEGNAE